MKSLLKSLDKLTISAVVKIITEFKDVEKIVIFGSRAKGNSSRVSDIDIAIFSKEWTSTDINLAKDRLENEVMTPLKIDLLNYYGLTKKSLKENILKEGIIIYDSGKN